MIEVISDIAKYKSDDPTAVIQNGMRGRDVIEFLGLWESLHNPDFNPIEFEGLETKPVQMHLQCLRKNGLMLHKQLALYQNLVDMGNIRLFRYCV